MTCKSPKMSQTLPAVEETRYIFTSYASCGLFILGQGCCAHTAQSQEVVCDLADKEKKDNDTGIAVMILERLFLTHRMDENYNIVPHGVNFQDPIFPDTPDNHRMFASLFQFSNCTPGTQIHTYTPEWEAQEDSRVRSPPPNRPAPSSQTFFYLHYQLMSVASTWTDAKAG